MKSLRIVGMGASMTAGTPGFFSPRERPPAGEGNPESQYGYWLVKGHPEWEFLNRGMRGQRTDQMLMRFDYDVRDTGADVMILLAGTNDLYQGRGVDRALRGVRALRDRAALLGVRVIGATLPPLNLASRGLKAAILEFNDALLGESGDFWGLCDLYRVLEDPENPGNISATPDDVHPDVRGYRQMGEALAATLEQALERAPF